MKKVLALLVLLFALLLGVLVAQSYTKNRGGSLFTKTATATIDGHKFKIEVEKTAKEKEIGLSEKNSLDKDSGMLFPFDHPDYYSFWMKNMKFPIDIIFIKDGAIVTIYENVSPPTAMGDNNIPVYQPKTPADSVLEINAGQSFKYGFTQGDKVKLENL